MHYLYYYYLGITPQKADSFFLDWTSSIFLRYDVFFLPRRSRRLWWRLILLYNHIGKKGSWLWQCLFIINSGSINLGNQFSFFAVANLWNFYAFLEKKLVFIIYWNAKLHSSEIQDVRLNWLPGETLHNLPYFNE